MSAFRLLSLSRRIPARWRIQVGQIKRRQSNWRSLTDRELRRESLGLRYRVHSGTPLEQVVTDAFSLVRESARRTLGIEHFDVQILGGLALFAGNVAVMETGEGKTLTATLAAYVAALNSEGVHLTTANDYLADRDAQEMAPVYQALGLNVGVVTSPSSQQQRLDAYRMDVTYTTAREIGFDFLRDRLRVQRLEQNTFNEQGLFPGTAGIDGCVQREFATAIVDEVDSILIDEARTPLVVSAAAGLAAETRNRLYSWAAQTVSQFAPAEHYLLEPDKKRVSLNLAGRQLARKLQIPGISAGVSLPQIYEFVERAILVEKCYHQDRHYVIHGGEVVIVDESTGRLSEGRRWRAGLHQAIEAKEKLAITGESEDAARITVQELFLKYRHLAGMTGTVASSGPELRRIYRMKSCPIPTHRPSRRKQIPIAVHHDEEAKWQAIAEETRQVVATGRPVLIGTRSIDKSQQISRVLKNLALDHEVLNANEIAREAQIIAEAGQAGKITVATNMAGRGTDIKLAPEVSRRGGLHIICTEYHDSARIDRQLIGRCGRQGDPGSYRQHLCLQDEILENAYGPHFAHRIRSVFGQNSSATLGCRRFFDKAQSRLETKHYRARRQLLFQAESRRGLQTELGLDPYLDLSGDD